MLACESGEPGAFRRRHGVHGETASWRIVPVRHVKRHTTVPTTTGDIYAMISPCLAGRQKPYWEAYVR